MTTVSRGHMRDVQGDLGAVKAPAGGTERHAFLVLLSEKFGDKVFPLLPEGVTSIGRSAERHVSISDQQVSSNHAEIFKRDGTWVIRDLHSKNGTRVNGATVREHLLKPNDRIELGGAATLFFTDRQFKKDTGRQGKAPTSEHELTAGLPPVPMEEAPPERPNATRRHEPNVNGTSVIPKLPRPPAPGVLQDTSPDPGPVSPPVPQRASVRTSRSMIVVPAEEVAEALRAPRPARVEGGLDQRAIGLLYQLAQALGAARTEKDLLERALDLTLALIPADRAYAFVFQRGEEAYASIPAPAVVRNRPGFTDEAAAIAVSTTIVEEVLRNRTAVATSDAGADERFRGAESVQRNDIHAVMAAPLVHQTRVLGVFYLEATAPGYMFSRSELMLLSAIAFHTGLALENARSVEELEARVAERAGEIERLSSERAYLLSVAAHDLKTPLAGILGYLEVMQPRVEADPATQLLAGDLGVVVDAARGMMDLLTDLLDRQRAEAGHMDLRPEPTDLGEFLTGALAIYERWAAGVGRRVELELGASLPSVRLDRRRVTQILNNLVHNALKYTPRGTAVRIEARAQHAPEAIEIAVTDCGHGFDGSDTDRILAIFARGTKREGAPEHEGHGLGLAIVKKLVEMHGGVLEIDGRPGRGARFAVRLPVDGPRTTKA